MQLKGLTVAVAHADGREWVFERRPLWQRSVRVRRADSENDIGVFRPTSNGGRFETCDKKSFELAAPTGRRRQWIWGQDGEALVHFEAGYGWLKAIGTVRITPRATTLTETPLLVLLGWYRILERGGRIFRLADLFDLA
jgi:hypothetical protein